MRSNLLLLIAVFILASCQDKGVPQRNAVLRVNEINIVYDECGNGDTTLLFVHGWCISKEYWQHQSAYFCDRYKVVALDLPGFGQSGKNRSEWTFDQYADDVNSFIKEKKLKNVILIGHSMSGDILLLTDTKYPSSVVGIVGIDNLHSPGTKHTEEQNKEIGGFFAMMDSSFKTTVDVYARQNLFPAGADSVAVNRVVNDFKNNDSLIAIKVLRSLFVVYQKEQDLMQKLTHKLYLVNSDMNPTQIDSLNKYCKAAAHVEYVKGTGHYPMIEKPDEFNAALEKVIRMMRK